jgi:hypothetical protein
MRFRGFLFSGGPTMSCKRFPRATPDALVERARNSLESPMDSSQPGTSSAISSERQKRYAAKVRTK